MINLVRPTMLASVVITSLLVACSKDEVVVTQVPETNKQPTVAQVEGSVFEPALVDATDQRIAQLKVPAGFTISKFADQLGKPRMLTVSSSGNVYVTSREAGTVTLLRDTKWRWESRSEAGRSND